MQAEEALERLLERYQKLEQRLEGLEERLEEAGASNPELEPVTRKGERASESSEQRGDPFEPFQALFELSVPLQQPLECLLRLHAVLSTTERLRLEPPEGTKTLRSSTSSRSRARSRST